MEEQTVDMALSQSRDRGGQETFKKREIVKFVNSEDTQEPENNEESESLIKVKDA